MVDIVRVEVNVGELATMRSIVEELMNQALDDLVEEMPEATDDEERTGLSTEEDTMAPRTLFEYHCYEGEDSSDAELWHHTHQRVTVLAKTQDESDPNCEVTMYRVRFPDGFEYEVFDDELLHSEAEYERPDYTA